MDIKLKIKIIREIITSSSRVYLHIYPHSNLIVGSRGLINDEKEKGLLLVFGPQSYKNLKFENEIIFVDMRFSGKWESLQVPISAITTIFDSPISPTFVINFNINEAELINEKKRQPKITKENEKIIKVDFKKD